MSADDTASPPRTFSAACSSVERTLLVAAFMASPIVTWRMVSSEIQTARALGIGLGQMLRDYGAVWSTATTILGSLFLLVFVPLYLQFRGRTVLSLDDRGLRFKREAFLPFGWFARDEQVDWADLLVARYQRSRRLLVSKARLELEWADHRLRLNVADFWETGDGKRPPLIAQPPEGVGGWRDHPLVTIVLEKELKNRVAALKTPSKTPPAETDTPV